MAQMNTMFPNASATKKQQVMDTFNEHMVAFEMNTCYNKAHFFAQVRAEVGPDMTMRENLKYRTSRLLQKFKTPFNTLEKKKEAYLRGKLVTEQEKNKAVSYGRAPGDTAADEEAIANWIYADANRSAKTKLGNTAEGDGWKYIGRGLIQLTEKYNFEQMNSKVAEAYKISNPSDLEKPKEATIFSMAFWKAKALHLATAGRLDNNYITSIVNRYTDTYLKREYFFRGKPGKRNKPDIIGCRELFDTDACIVGDILELKENIAPWMQYAVREYNSYMGQHAKQSGKMLRWQVYDYFETSSGKALTNNGFWCAAFVNYCFWKSREYRDTNLELNTLAFDWATNEKGIAAAIKKERPEPNGWENGEEITAAEVFVGAVLVLEISHVAFIAGESPDGASYVYLGGNQGMGASKRGITLSRVAKDSPDILAFMKPRGYEPMDNEKILPKLESRQELSYEDTH